MNYSLANERSERQDSALEDTMPIMFREDWALTWPIWHMLSRNERREIAHQHGYNTIGEFEEFMTMQRAVGVSTDDQLPYENHLSYPLCLVSEQRVVESSIVDVELDDYEPEENECNEAEIDDVEKERISNACKLSNAELLQVGGQILMLHDDMVQRIFEFLPVDSYAVLALVSPHWRNFTRTEAVYKRLCERLYLQQSKRRALHVSRFGNSYRTMLEKRPRIRAGGGAYIIKYSKVKPIQRDMWTEVPHGVVLETVYYRYLYFQEDGTVLYALTTSGPHEMFPRLRKINLKCKVKDGPTDDNATVWGRYQVSGKNVTVVARQPWQWVRLDLAIETDITIHGRFGYLSVKRHVTSSSPDFDARNAATVEFDIPDEPFRYVRSKRL